jgi:hypothetical protein
LFLVVLAYLWATAGLFMVGAPYLLRDLIGWVTDKAWRYHAVAWSGIAYGALLIVVSLLFFKA